LLTRLTAKYNGRRLVGSGSFAYLRAGFSMNIVANWRHGGMLAKSLRNKELAFRHIFGGWRNGQQLTSYLFPGNR
jgi:hypothetical protein